MLHMGALPGYPEEARRWLWALEELRRRTLRIMQGLDQRTLDWEGPNGDENAIGTLLYHIALVEMDWLFMDIREVDMPAAVRELLPQPMRTGKRLTPMRGVALSLHMDRLDRSRRILLEDLRSVTLEDWRRPRNPKGADYSVTPEWIVFHLVEHEAGHASQIASLKARKRP